MTKKNLVFQPLPAHDANPRMNTPRSTARGSRRHAFTLIELLVVITIIAVLAGLLLPVTQKVLENARKTSAKSTETQIVGAVNSYQVEYGQFPVVLAGGVPADISFGVGTTTDNVTLFNVLRALNSNDATTSALNSRHIVYFESKNAKNASSPRDGFVTTAPATGNPNNPVTLKEGDLVDPWGNLYLVRVDSGYTNAVLNPYSGGGDDDSATQAADPTNKDVLRTPVISWSYGNDGLKGDKGRAVTVYSPTPGDDVDSWQ